MSLDVQENDVSLGGARSPITEKDEETRDVQCADSLGTSAARPCHHWTVRRKDTSGTGTGRTKK